MGQRSHPIAQVTADHLVVQSSFGGCHCKLLSVIIQVCNRLDDNLVVAIDQCIEVHADITCQRTNDLFIREVASDGLNTGRR